MKIPNATTKIAMEAADRGEVEEPSLAQVRHGMGSETANPFRISSGYSRVCTTLAIELEVFGQAGAELPEQKFLLCRWLGYAAQTDLPTVGSGKNDIGALQGGKQRDGPHG